MKKPEFISGEYYHIYNRGADKRIIFDDTSDYSRFMQCLEYFNDINPAIDWRLRNTTEVQPPEKPSIVDIIAYCLMPNHYHLILRPLYDSGVIQFMQKLGTGYTMYFNNKNERSGVLFQGRYKAKHIMNTQYLKNLIHYIHANPLGEKTRDTSILDRYRWSSWNLYTGAKIINRRSLINNTFITKLMGKNSEYIADFKDWLKTRDVLEISDLKID